MKSCPRLRAYISSTKGTAKPRLERNSTSHSSTPLISTAEAWLSQVLCCTKKDVIKPHRIICTVGQ